MGDPDKSKPVVIELEELTNAKINEKEKGTSDKDVLSLFHPQQAPPQNYQYNQPPPEYYYGGQGRGPNTPLYQTQLDGRPVYYAGGPPQNVSAGGQVIQPNYNIGQPDDSGFYRDAGIFVDAFNTTKIRNRFVQRVYTILSVQLVFSFGVILLVIFEKNLKAIFRQYWMPIIIASMVVYLITVIALMCVSSLRRSFPINFILLSILTIALTLSLCVLSITMKTSVVLFAIGTTAIVCFLVSIFACQTKWDVTGCGMCLCVGLLVLVLFGLIIMILQLCGIYIKILHILYAALGTLLFCFWLMYDTQQIMGGRKYEISPEEYIYGALALYIDIMYIFMYILTLYNMCLGGGNE